jgi:hypothetical protein
MDGFLILTLPEVRHPQGTASFQLLGLARAGFGFSVPAARACAAVIR